MLTPKSQFYFIADLENILRGLDIASAATGDTRPEGATYRAGFHDALSAVAAAIGGRLISGDRVRVIEPLRIEGVTNE